jgi:Ni/Co efflux regulator RcnB
MRKAILITTAALCFGASAAMAQDTTRRQSQQQRSTQQDTSSIQQRDQTRDQSGVRRSTEMEKGWTRVEDREVPASLRTSLSETKYKGWERSGVYRNERGDRYQVRVGNDANPTVYYFDRNGKPEKNPD